MELGGSRRANTWLAKEGLRDYSLIRLAAEGSHRAWPTDTAPIHRDHRHRSVERLAAPLDGIMVVVIHHAPDPAYLDGLAYGSHAAAYASDLSSLMLENRLALWLYGHTHALADFIVGDTRVLNVQIRCPADVDSERAVGDLMTDLLEL